MLVLRNYFAHSIPCRFERSGGVRRRNEILLSRAHRPALSGAVIAVIALYYASSIWNSYFNAMLYLQDLEKMPGQQLGATCWLPRKTPAHR